jgi:heme exporter protein D
MPIYVPIAFAVLLALSLGANVVLALKLRALQERHRALRKSYDERKREVNHLAAKLGQKVGEALHRGQSQRPAAPEAKAQDESSAQGLTAAP